MCDGGEVMSDGGEVVSIVGGVRGVREEAMCDSGGGGSCLDLDLDLGADLKAHGTPGGGRGAQWHFRRLQIGRPRHMMHSQGPRQTLPLHPLRSRAGWWREAASRAIFGALRIRGCHPLAHHPSHLPSSLHYRCS